LRQLSWWSGTAQTKCSARWATNAYRRLQGLNLKTLDYKKYDGCDHLMIVREAMPDAFAFFDRAPARTATLSKP